MRTGRCWTRRSGRCGRGPPQRGPTSTGSPFQRGDRVSVQRPGHPYHERVGTVCGPEKGAYRNAVMVHFDGEPRERRFPAQARDLEQVPWKD